MKAETFRRGERSEKEVRERNGDLENLYPCEPEFFATIDRQIRSARERRADSLCDDVLPDGPPDDNPVTTNRGEVFVEE